MSLTFTQLTPVFAAEASPIDLRQVRDRETLDAIRADVGVPVRVASGPRCEFHNRQVKGVTGSAHLTGEAADLTCTDSLARYALLRSALTRTPPVRRIGIGKTFIHVDVSTRHAPDVAWLY